MKSRITAFQWDKGNIDKNLLKHRTSDQECEEVFFDFSKKILKDALHCGKEERYIVIGKTKKQRLLFIVFTVRSNKIRIISARDLNKKEKHLYEKRTSITKI
ncbi:MAG: BrnT family toxin [Candidatus Pacebacteria bacterium]|nr:BrnT family toxin [Candidatus Paceibacterota bacterium]